MSSISDEEICSKCVEISKALLNTTIGVVGIDLKDTRRIGDSARLAASIKRTGEISPRTFDAVSTTLKIDTRIAEDSILRDFEELGWVEVKKEGKKIVKIDEFIPPTTNLLTSLGKLWRDYGPTTIDESSIISLNKLAKKPYTKEALQSELGINDSDFETTLGYGEQVNYLGTFHSSKINKEIIWTPFYWNHNIEQVRRYIDKQTEESFNKISELMQQISNSQGVPYELINNPKNTSILNSGIHYGLIPSVQIKTPKGKYDYLFTPRPHFDVGFGVFEKAELLVSCVRHGQYHAEYSKIKYPSLILHAMKNNSLKPHPYAHIQYFLLKEHGLVNIIEDKNYYGKAYKLNWIDTPENNLAMEIALEILATGVSVPASSQEVETRQLLLDGFFGYTSEQRKIRDTKHVLAGNEFERLLNETIGVKE